MVTQNQINQSKLLHQRNIESLESYYLRIKHPCLYSNLPDLDNTLDLNNFDVEEFLSLTKVYYINMMLPVWIIPYGIYKLIKRLFEPCSDESLYVEYQYGPRGGRYTVEKSYDGGEYKRYR